MTCVVRKNDKLIKFAEKSRKIVFLNDKRSTFDCAVVDGCLVKEPIRKCDNYLRDDERIWLIELKGKDIEHAVRQIVGTTEAIQSHIGDREIIPVIIASKCPAISGQQKRLRALKAVKGNLSKRIILRTRMAKISV